jgi:hypothetical protein
MLHGLVAPDNQGPADFQISKTMLVFLFRLVGVRMCVRARVFTPDPVTSRARVNIRACLCAGVCNE